MNATQHAESTAQIEAPELAWGRSWPNRVEFRELAAERRVIPVVRRILADDVTPVGLYRRLGADRPGTFILESAEHDGAWARWSFIGVASRATLIGRDGQAHWSGDVPAGVPTQGRILEVLKETLSILGTPAIPGLPPLTGGLVGALGWDVLREWEPNLRALAPSEHTTPDVALCLASDMVAVDHHDGSVWLIANALNMDGSAERVDEAHADALARLDGMEAMLARPATSAAAVLEDDAPGTEPELRFRTERADFEQAVLAAKQAIYDGEAFQIVLSQRLDIDCPAEPLDVYRVLRTINPSPYMYYLRLEMGEAEVPGEDTFVVVGSSPETHIRVADRRLTMYPAAGSRPRGATPGEDRALGEELLADPKEIAEHVMLVDLVRNDLTKVCRPETIEVVDFQAIHRYSHIMHMVSTVEAELREESTALDALTATFPAGTLSGAPKPRAIEIIDTLEPARRGIYGGVVGYFDFAGEADLAIAIRTAVITGGLASVQAGAGLVADSDPATEYTESRNKAAAAVRAIQVAARLRGIAEHS
ncbi:anthranilate synthase component I [Bogoriella caseilytica]|uniref:Anthranilate synthase component 1 n=1 Tax=Bogoriella caseilytica TaxID=56055 RepID=A0A3N2B8R9_9MICO|nr:anthranilate synthase component I [Bogoriella caseilytica]ROR71673.1 anthranilate synthase component I [Bogoriella caseilytica]